MRCANCRRNQRGPADNGTCRCPHQDKSARDINKRAYPPGVSVERKGSKKMNSLKQERAKYGAVAKDGKKMDSGGVVSSGTGSDASGG